MKVKAIQKVMALIDGVSTQLEVGKVYDVSADEADNLIRGKYAEKVADGKAEAPKQPATGAVTQTVPPATPTQPWGNPQVKTPPYPPQATKVVAKQPEKAVDDDED